MSNGNSTTRSRPVNQADRADIPEPSKIGASTSYDFEARNLTAYGGLLPVATVGDYWQNPVKLEEIIPAQAGTEYPRALDGARSCPPEDCGGASAYADPLDILLDPKREDDQLEIFLKSQAEPDEPAGRE